MRLRYDDYRARDTEIVAVSVTEPERARLYHQVFGFVHPYACDPQLVASRRFGIGTSAVAKFRGGLRGMLQPELRRAMHERVELPDGASESHHFAMMGGVFAIDRLGKVGYAHVEHFAALSPAAPELMRLLERLP